MKLSKRFLSKVASYVQWAKCRTPMTGWVIMEDRVLGVPKVVTSMSPEEAILRWESHGERIEGSTDPAKLGLYKRGKAMRDWWTHELGVWERLASRSMFFPEELTEFFMPDCFFELFKRYPIAPWVRHFYDNQYSLADFEKDIRGTDAQPNV